MPKKQTAAKQKRARTYARNRATASRQLPTMTIEADSTYFLKLVVVVVLGTLWIKLAQPITWYGVPFGGFPLGAIVALVGVKLFEKNQFERWIWYAVTVVVAIICYFVPAGIVL